VFRAADHNSSSLQRIETGLSEMRLISTEKDGDASPSTSKGEENIEITSPTELVSCSDKTPDAEIPVPRAPTPIQPISSGPPIQAASAYGMGFPAWLSPKVSMPSAKFKAKVQDFSPTTHTRLIETVFSNCQIACFDFYQANGLWRTKHGDKDTRGERKLFQMDNGRFPSSPEDLSLQHWLFKMRHACSGNSINTSDSVQANNLYDFMASYETFAAVPKIPLLCDPVGRIDKDNFEECLVYSLRLCRHLQAWDAFGRLKALWNDIHTTSSNLEEDASPYSEFFKSPLVQLPSCTPGEVSVPLLSDIKRTTEHEPLESGMKRRRGLPN
jgi:hypothetical protein